MGEHFHVIPHVLTPSKHSDIIRVSKVFQTCQSSKLICEFYSAKRRLEEYFDKFGKQKKEKGVPCNSNRNLGATAVRRTTIDHSENAADHYLSISAPGVLASITGLPCPIVIPAAISLATKLTYVNVAVKSYPSKLKRRGDLYESTTRQPSSGMFTARHCRSWLCE